MSKRWARIQVAPSGCYGAAQESKDFLGGPVPASPAGALAVYVRIAALIHGDHRYFR